MTLVSVVIPTYNRADVLGRAVDSALVQSHDALEVIVVDDGSTDDTAVVLESYDDARLVTLETTENGGANAARNLGIEHASGEYVSFLDSDDELEPTHIERVLSRFEGSTDRVGGVYTSYHKLRDGAAYDMIPAEERLTLADLRRGNPIGGFSATTFRKAVFERVGYLDEELPAVQDYEFYLRVLEEYEILGVKKVLLKRHTEGDRIGTDPEKKIRGYQLVLEKHGEKIDRRRRGEFAANVALIYAANGRRRPALAYFKQAARIDPTNWRHPFYYGSTALGCPVLATVRRVETAASVLLGRVGLR